ncbi:MAG TPA: hypothetical protein VM076_07440 [Gemmatimonadaceae bacterium]|nr:hypothetical protein [Gemmatimonadaceae bacterium]
MSLATFAALAACDRAEPPTMPQTASPLLEKSSQSLTRATFSFRNLTDRTASRLVIQFNSAISGIPYVPSTSYVVSGSTLTVSALAVVPLDEFLTTVTVEGRNIRVDSWYWAAADGSVLGSVVRGCGAKVPCEEIVIPGLRIATPYVTIEPFQEIGYCYYFRTQNATSMAVRTWKAKLGAAAERLNVILSETDVRKPWTHSAANCTPLFNAANFQTLRTTWAFTAYPPAGEYTFPGDDGTGKPLGMVIPPDRPGYIYVHYENATENAVTTRAEIEAIPYDRGVAVTPANSYMTYNANINLAPATLKTETMSCPLPPNAKFFWMSTYSYKQTTRAVLIDSVYTLFTATDPFAPGAATFTSPFYAFKSSALTYQFTYANNTNRTITSGPSPATDENAIALTYFFPATEGKVCVNSTGPL